MTSRSKIMNLIQYNLPECYNEIEKRMQKKAKDLISDLKIYIDILRKKA